MDEETHRGARACMCVTDSISNRQQGLLAGQRLPDYAGEETGCCLIGLAWPDADGRQSDADALEKTSPSVVCKQQFADCFLRPIGRERGQVKVVRNRTRKRRAIDRD